MLVSQHLRNDSSACRNKRGREAAQNCSNQLTMPPSFCVPLTLQLASLKPTSKPSLGVFPPPHISKKCLLQHHRTINQTCDIPQPEAKQKRLLSPIVKIENKTSTVPSFSSSDKQTTSDYERLNDVHAIVKKPLLYQSVSSSSRQRIIKSKGLCRKSLHCQKRSREDLRLYFPICPSKVSRRVCLGPSNIAESQSRKEHTGSLPVPLSSLLNSSTKPCTKSTKSSLSDDTHTVSCCEEPNSNINSTSEPPSSNDQVALDELHNVIASQPSKVLSERANVDLPSVLHHGSKSLKTPHVLAASSNGTMQGSQSVCLQTSTPNCYIERSYYMGLYLCKNIQDANAFVAKPNYFKNFKKCANGQKVSAASRRAIAQFIVDVGRGIATPISDFSIHMAINLFDRYMSRLGLSKKMEIKEKAAESIEIVGAACLYICSKLEDSWCLSLSDICKVFDEGSDGRRNEVLHWELEISREFNFMFYSPTILDFMYKMIDLASPFLAEERRSSNMFQAELLGAPQSPVRETTINPFLFQSNMKKNNSLKTLRVWNAKTVPFVAGTGNRGYSSPQYFLRSENKWSQESTSMISQFDERLAIEALSIGELSLLHHTCIGIPVHLIAAGALLLAITQIFQKTRCIKNLPQPVRAFLGRDRRRLTRVVSLISAIIEERNVLVQKKASSN